MRKAVVLAQDLGLQVDYTLHDALYIEEDTDEIYKSMKSLANCMDEAFRFFFPEHLQEWAGVRLDGDVWSPDFIEETYHDEVEYCGGTFPVKQQQTYVDPRGVKEYKQFKKYFKKDTALEDL